jgi:hypothetical protein
LVPRKIFGLRSDDMKRKWRRLRKKEFYDMRSSPNIIRVIKSRRTRWAGHVTHKEMRGACRVLVGET